MENSKLMNTIMNIETNNQSITTDLAAPTTISTKMLNNFSKSLRGGSSFKKKTSAYKNGKNLIKTASIN